MNTLNVLSTNIGSYLSMRQTLSAAKDCVKHFGQGERIRFELYAYLKQKDIRNLNPLIFKDLPYKDPWGKNKNTLLEAIARVCKDWPRARYQIFATLYTSD